MSVEAYHWLLSILILKVVRRLIQVKATMTHQISVSRVIRGRSLFAALFLVTLHSSGASAAGGIVTDGTVGAPGNLGIGQTLTGGNSSDPVTVTQAMGSTVGTNLFHSFSGFNIAPGQRVTFTEDKAGFIDNVITRVTGNEVSHINGLLSVTPGGKANFYLLNPNGVLFGKGAIIDVPGDFHVTTASYLKFKDGTQYGADPATSQLSSVMPSAFGFTEASKFTNVLIEVKDEARLETKNEKTAIDLVGSHIAISNAAKLLATQEGTEIRLVAAKGKHEISAMKDESNYLTLPHEKPSQNAGGEITLDGGADMFSESSTGGRIGLWGSHLQLSNGSFVEAANNGSGNPELNNGIHVSAKNLTIRDDDGHDSGFITSAIASGRGSDIRLSILDRIDIENKYNLGSYNGIKSRSLSPGTGDGGDIYVEAGSLLMSGGPNKNNYAGVLSASNGLGSSGNIWIRLRNDLVMRNDSRIETIAEGGPKAGNIDVKIGGSLDILNRSLILSQSIKTQAEDIKTAGDSGSIKVSADNILIRDKDQANSQLATGLYNFNYNDSGRTGEIDVVSRGNISILGGYAYRQPPTSSEPSFVGIASYSRLADAASKASMINIKAGDKITIRGHGPDEPSEAPGFFRFKDTAIATGIFSILQGKNSEAPPPSIHVFAGGGISLMQSIIAVEGDLDKPVSLPSINLKTPAQISLVRSAVYNGIKVNKNDFYGPSAAVTLSGGAILLQDRSIIESNVPGSGLELNSASGIFISSKRVNQNFTEPLAASYAPDLALLFDGFIGSGKITLSALNNISIFNASFSNVKTGESNSNSILNVGISADSVAISGFSTDIVNNGSVASLNKSDITFNVRGFFPLFNVINGGFYSNEGGRDLRTIPKYPYELGNSITKKLNGSLTENFSITGALFGISGIMPTLNPPVFESSTQGNACQTYKSGDLSITGKGGLGDPLGYLLH